MIRLLVAVFVISLISNSYAGKLRALKLDPQRRVFAIENQNLKKGETILIYSGDLKLLALGKLSGCKDKYCFGQVIKAKKGFVLESSMIFSNTKLDQVSKKEEVITHVTEAKEEKNSTNQSVYAGIGGPPVSYGLRFSYLRDYNSKIHYGATLGLVSTELSGIDVSGTSFGGMIGYKFKTYNKFEIYGDFELGMFNSTLDFTMDSDGPSVNESQLYYSFAGSFSYVFQNNFDLTGRIGYAINTFSESYENDLGEKYTVPFAGGMVFIELGVSYRF